MIVNACDWGDSPDTSSTTNRADYQTLAVNGGPVHVIVPGLKLGDLIDAESDGLPDTEALGDNNNMSSDEDGITIFSTLDLAPGITIQLPLDITNTTGDTAYVEAWIDWNGDGDFEDANEMVVDLKDNADGVFPDRLLISVPHDATTGSLLGLRIRLSHTDNMTPYGLITSGEIEDYMIGIGCPQVVCIPIGVNIKR